MMKIPCDCCCCCAPELESIDKPRMRCSSISRSEGTPVALLKLLLALWFTLLVPVSVPRPTLLTLLCVRSRERGCVGRGDDAAGRPAVEAVALPAAALVEVEEVELTDVSNGSSGASAEMSTGVGPSSALVAALLRAGEKSSARRLSCVGRWW